MRLKRTFNKHKTMVAKQLKNDIKKADKIIALLQKFIKEYKKLKK